MSTVVDTWVETAPTIGVAPDEVVEISAWLRHVLTHRHRAIHQKEVDDFKRSIEEFSKNSGFKFTEGDNPSGIRFLEFCSSFAWAPKAPDNNEGDRLKQFYKLNQDVLAGVKAEIDASLPVETAQKWRPRVELTIASLKARMDSQVEQLNSDFLFPAFKEKFSDLQVAEALKLIKGETPKYGPIDQIMETPDEAFALHLSQFSGNFDNYYLFALAIQQIRREHALSHDWQDYSMGLRPPDGSWPVVIDLDQKKAPTSQP